LAIAAVLNGASRQDAAKAGGMDLLTLRDWVIRFNEKGPLGTHTAIEMLCHQIHDEKRVGRFKNAGCSHRLASLSLSRGTRQHRFLVATQVDYICSTDTGCVDS
jgi:hypothetical protein